MITSYLSTKLKSAQAELFIFTSYVSLFQSLDGVVETFDEKSCSEGKLEWIKLRTS